MPSRDTSKPRSVIFMLSDSLQKARSGRRRVWEMWNFFSTLTLVSCEYFCHQQTFKIFVTVYNVYIKCAIVENQVNLLQLRLKAFLFWKKKKPPKNKNYRKVGSLVQMESKKSGLKSFRKKPSGLDVINFSLKVGFVFLPPLFNWFRWFLGSKSF